MLLALNDRRIGRRVGVNYKGRDDNIGVKDIFILSRKYDQCTDELFV